MDLLPIHQSQHCRLLHLDRNHLAQREDDWGEGQGEEEGREGGREGGGKEEGKEGGWEGELPANKD